MLFKNNESIIVGIAENDTRRPLYLDQQATTPLVRILSRKCVLIIMHYSEDTYISKERYFFLLIDLFTVQWPWIIVQSRGSSCCA